MGSDTAGERSASAPRFRRRLRWASSATCAGGWSPAMSALIMARAETPRISVATLPSLIFAVRSLISAATRTASASRIARPRRAHPRTRWSSAPNDGPRATLPVIRVPPYLQTLPPLGPLLRLQPFEQQSAFLVQEEPDGKHATSVVVVVVVVGA
jgi:hypothetical protein